MAEIVVDVFASLLVLWALGVTINLMSLIGVIVVSGIVINDSILKVDTINSGCCAVLEPRKYGR